MIHCLERLPSLTKNRALVLNVRWKPRGIRRTEENADQDSESAYALKEPLKRVVQPTPSWNEATNLQEVRKTLNEGLRSVRSSEADFPSDKKQKQQLQRWFPNDSQNETAEMPEHPSAVLFPGHGTHFVGMGKKLLNYAGAKRIYEEANAILGFDLMKHCLQGSEIELQSARIGQLAVFVTSIAALEKLKAEHPKAIEDCIASAGYSVGELAALVFAGALSFDDALRVVDIRATSMQSLSEAVPSGACSVFVSAASSLNELLVAARQSARQKGLASPVCGIAEYVATNVKVIGGHVECMQFIEANHAKFNIKQFKPLNVAGAYHTLLMRDAAKRVRTALEKINISTPRIAVYSNYNAEPFRSRHSVIRKVSEALYHPVKWEQSMHTLYRFGLKYDAFMKRRDELPDPPRTYGIGPGRQLGILLRNTNGRAYRQGYTAIDV